MDPLAVKAISDHQLKEVSNDSQPKAVISEEGPNTKSSANNIPIDKFASEGGTIRGPIEPTHSKVSNVTWETENEKTTPMESVKQPQSVSSTKHRPYSESFLPWMEPAAVPSNPTWYNSGVVISTIVLICTVCAIGLAMVLSTVSGLAGDVSPFSPDSPEYKRLKPVSSITEGISCKKQPPLPPHLLPNYPNTQYFWQKQWVEMSSVERPCVDSNWDGKTKTVGTIVSYVCVQRRDQLPVLTVICNLKREWEVIVDRQNTITCGCELQRSFSEVQVLVTPQPK